MHQSYWATFIDLICAPFREEAMIWGIVPLYFALLLSELTSAKANYRTAIQTGFSFLWAGAQWVYPYFKSSGLNAPQTQGSGILSINPFVTVLVLVLGVMALVSGLRRRYPKYCTFLGHTRFGNYFMITIYPMQTHTHHLTWTWERLGAIIVFAVPVWLALHLGLMPLRGRK